MDNNIKFLRRCTAASLLFLAAGGILALMVVIDILSKIDTSRYVDFEGLFILLPIIAMVIFVIFTMCRLLQSLKNKDVLQVRSNDLLIFGSKSKEMLVLVFIASFIIGGFIFKAPRYRSNSGEIDQITYLESLKEVELLQENGQYVYLYYPFFDYRIAFIAGTFAIVCLLIISGVLNQSKKSTASDNPSNIL